jgi:hypothetical protein
MEIIMFYDGDLPKDFTEGSEITSGPTRDEVYAGIKDRRELIFITAARPEGVRVMIWSLKIHDSLGSNWTLTGNISLDRLENIPCEIRYWVRGTGVGGELKAVTD